jgi:hypothetical protein
MSTKEKAIQIEKRKTTKEEAKKHHSCLRFLATDKIVMRLELFEPGGCILPNSF